MTKVVGRRSREESTEKMKILEHEFQNTKICTVC